MPEPAREPPVGAPRTEGQRLLLAAGTGAEVVARTGLAKGAVSEWRSGKKLPGRAAREKLASVLSIPPVSWDRPAGEDLDELDDEDEAAEEGAVAELRQSPRLALVAHVANIRQSLDRKDLSEGERTKRMGVYTHALRALGQAEQDEAMLETRIVLEHPAFQRAVRTILRVLKPHPEIAIAVAEALALEEDAG